MANFVTKWIERLTSSEGFKRKLASVLSAILTFFQGVPGAAEVVTAVQYIAEFFGITGLLHAGKEGTVGRFKLASLSSFVVGLLAIAPYVPSLQPLVPILQKLAGFLGAAVVGQITVAKKK